MPAYILFSRPTYVTRFHHQTLSSLPTDFTLIKKAIHHIFKYFRQSLPIFFSLPSITTAKKHTNKVNEQKSKIIVLKQVYFQAAAGESVD
jgi:hypothetical protein